MSRCYLCLNADQSPHINSGKCSVKCYSHLSCSKMCACYWKYQLSICPHSPVYLGNWKQVCPCSWGRGHSVAAVSCSQGNLWLLTWWVSRWHHIGWSRGLGEVLWSSCRRWTSHRSCSSQTPAKEQTQRSADMKVKPTAACRPAVWILFLRKSEISTW